MPRILDPSLITSLLPEAEVRSRAEYLANDIALQGMLTPEGLDAQFPEPVDRADKAYVAIVHRNAGLSIVSQYCLNSLMRDGYGRSGIHIAGEVCRLTHAVRDVTVQEEIIPLRYFSETTEPSTQDKYSWSPQDQLDIHYPTIDGNPGKRPTTRSWKHRLGFVKTATPYHELWLREFTGRILPAFCDKGILKVIDVPFVMDGGGIVAGTEPKFYIKTDQSGESSNPRPLELAGV